MTKNFPELIKDQNKQKKKPHETYKTLPQTHKQINKQTTTHIQESQWVLSDENENKSIIVFTTQNTKDKEKILKHPERTKNTLKGL
jgi:hypothetical protein